MVTPKRSSEILADDLMIPLARSQQLCIPRPLGDSFIVLSAEAERDDDNGRDDRRVLETIPAEMTYAYVFS